MLGLRQLKDRVYSVQVRQQIACRWPQLCLLSGTISTSPVPFLFRGLNNLVSQLLSLLLQMNSSILSKLLARPCKPPCPMTVSVADVRGYRPALISSSRKLTDVWIQPLEVHARINHGLLLTLTGRSKKPIRSSIDRDTIEVRG